MRPFTLVLGLTLAAANGSAEAQHPSAYSETAWQDVLAGVDHEDGGDSESSDAVLGTETQQPPAVRPGSPLPPTQPPRRATVPDAGRATMPRLPTRSPQFYRLASVPEMFGDFFGGGTITATSVLLPGTAAGVLPTAGGARRFKIAENNKPFPQDRVFFMYNHFHNALETEVSGVFGGPAPDDFSVDRYTFGIEKTLCDGLWSVELRTPFVGRYEEETPGFEVSGGKVGNLSVVLKRLLCASECAAVAGGMSIDLPTGSDVDGSVLAADFDVENDAVHLMPYLGFLMLPSDRTFVQGYVQIDVPTNGNRVSVDGGGSGTLDEQVLLFLDVTAGYWLMRSECEGCVTGVAPVVELHYTTTLEDADTVTLAAPAATAFGNAANRIDVLDVTVGLHVAVTGSLSVRAGAAFPLRDDEDKLFDAELQLSVNWRF